MDKNEHAQFKAATQEMVDRFKANEKAIFRAVMGAALVSPEQMPEDLRIELIERAMHLYKLQSAFALIASATDLFDDSADLPSLRQTIARFATSVHHIGDQLDRATELLEVSIAAARDVLEGELGS